MIQRRTFLRGVGCAMALPWLEAFVPRACAAPTHPQRLVFAFVPNGKHMPSWTPKAEGAGFALSPLLEPLKAFRDDILVLSGLTLDGARSHGDGPGDHARALGAFLTCSHPQKRGVKAGVSADQVAARLLGRRTRLPSLELGIERNRSSGSCDSGYSCAYSSNLSWRGPKTPMGKEIDPRRVFERLFGQRLTPAQRARRDRDRRSILDAVSEDARELHKRLGRVDRERVDEYLTGVRELEQRLDRHARGEGPPEQSGLNDLRDKLPRRVPRNPQVHLRLMTDLLVLALTTDQTRVATFLFANAGSNRVYRHLGVRGGHHSLSHHGQDKRKLSAIQTINRFHIQELAYLVGKLATTKVRDGRLLDHVGLVYGSGIGDGDRHSHHDLPILLAGQLGGALTTGRHLRYAKETPLANLYVSLLRAVGVSVTRFGDSTRALSGLKT
jgi:hypothetical protein